MNFPTRGFVADIVSNHRLMPIVASLVILGLLFDLVRGKPRTVKETLANLALWLGNQAIFVLIGGASWFAIIRWAGQLAPWRIPTDFYSAAAVFVLLDFVYYWQHRCEHSVSFLWAMHQVHHSGHEFNFSTAVRGSTLTRLVNWLFITPIVILGFDLKLILGFHLINLWFQMIKHNDVIGRLGWLDRVFSTPYNHRIHHGQTPDTFGKNLGGMFVVWDRLFGTFAAGTLLQDFGSPLPQGIYNPILMQTWPVSDLLRKFWARKGFAGKCRALFGPPDSA
jgi:sterol desaturase/sphingolipid hydroxylase (fatty acid hydroxylase superfamily)